MLRYLKILTSPLCIELNISPMTGEANRLRKIDVSGESARHLLAFINTGGAVYNTLRGQRILAGAVHPGPC